MIHPNSREAYAELDISKRQGIILDIYKDGSQSYTDREILRLFHGSPHADLNIVRPRITELLEMGLLIEKGKTTCGWTKRTVRLVGLPEKQIEVF